MASKDADLSSLRIDRSSQGAKTPRKTRSIGKILAWILAGTVLIFGAIFLKGVFNPGVEVQLATVSLSSPAQANAVLTASGYVVARRKAAVASKGTGTLVFLGVDEGDPVKKGQVIARLDDSDVVAPLHRTRENLRLAQADLNDAKQSQERMRVLLKEGAVAQAEFDSAEARYGRVVATIEAARFAVKEAEVAGANNPLLPALDGTGLEKKADVGGIVAPRAGPGGAQRPIPAV